MKTVIGKLSFLAGIVIAILCLFAMPAKADEGPAVFPSQLTIPFNYPATFYVEPSDDIVSYQWVFLDKEDQVFVLDGTTAKTNRLVIPSMEKGLDTCHVFCIMENKDGEIITSQEAELTVESETGPKTVLYVENYCLEPGGSFDLASPSTIDPSYPNLGTGVISFSEDGSTITFDHVDFSNDEVICDRTISPAIGITYRSEDNTLPQIKLELIGENQFFNSFYQESTNGSGIPIDFFFLGEESVKAEVLIEGDGSLSIEGGTYLIRNNGPITVNAPLTLKGYEDHFCDGIHAARSSIVKSIGEGNDNTKGAGDTTVTVSEGVSIDADINGTCIFSDTAIFIRPEAKLDIYSSAPSVGAGNTAKYVLYSPIIDIEQADIKMDMFVDPQRFDPPYLMIGTFGGLSIAKGVLVMNDSNLEISASSGEGEPGFAFSVEGILGGTESSVQINRSTIKMDMDLPNVIDSDGISIGGDIDICDSVVSIKDSALGMVHGIYLRDDLKIKNSKIDVLVDAKDYFGDEFWVEGSSKAILTEGTIDVQLEKDNYVSAESKNGLAFGVDFAKSQKTPIEYDPNYVAKYITLGENNIFKIPSDSKISQSSRTNDDGEKYYYTETPYSLSDTRQPAAKVLIVNKTSEPVNPPTGDPMQAGIYAGIAGIALLVLALTFVLRKRAR